MTILHRRILYLSFTALFLLIAPLLLLYAEGFRFDIRHQLAYKTGLLSLSITPAPESVSVDGRAVRQPNSSVRVPGLAPGTHLVTVTKTGYRPWSTTVVIRSGNATTYDSITLIRDSVPDVVTKNVTQIVQSPDKKSALLIHTNNQLSLLSFDTNAELPLPSFSETPHAYAWSPASTAFIFSTKEGNTFLWQQGDTNYEPLTGFPRTVEKIIWDTQHPESLYILSQNKLYTVQWRTGASSLLQNTILSAVEQNGHVFTLASDGVGTLTVSSVELNGNTTALGTVPGQRDAEVLKNSGRDIAILDQGSKTVSVVTRTRPSRTTTLGPAVFASWNSQGTALVYGNEFEITLVENPGTTMMTTHLLNRTSGTLKNAFWLDATHGLLVEQQATLLLYQNVLDTTSDPIAVLDGSVTDLVASSDGLTIYALLDDGSVVRRQL